MNWLEELERRLQSGIGGLARTATRAPKTRSLIEVCRQIEDDLKDKVVVQTGGVRKFPFNRVDVMLFVRDEEQRAAYEAILCGEEGMKEQLRRTLAEDGALPRDWTATVTITVDPDQAAGERPFHLQCARAAPPAAPAAIPRKQARLTVVKGRALVPELVTSASRVNIGRMVEVTAASGAVIRINDLAFDEAETSVAREHAFLRWDEPSGSYLLFDALSGPGGTRLFRSGESHTLPRGSTKGTLLRHGDEIHLGQARIRFEWLDG